MNLMKLCYSVLLTCSLFGQIPGQESHGQREGLRVEETRVTIDVTKMPAFDVFFELINKLDVAIGFEESTFDRGHDDYHFPTNIAYDEWGSAIREGRAPLLSGGRNVVKSHLISLSYRNTPLTIVLDDLVKQMKYYDWKVENGVVNIVPTEGRSLVFERLLSTNVKLFVFPENWDVGFIRSLLIRLPEVSSFFTSNQLAISDMVISPWFIDRKLPTEMRFTDLSLKQLLNEITRSKRGGWILKSAKDRREDPEDQREWIDISI